MSELVSAAPPGAGVVWAEHIGSLMIFEPLSLESGINTVHGEADAVKANVSIITGPGEGEDHSDVLVFPRMLAGQLRSNIGKKVVGRLGQGEAKKGQSPPWLLAEATEDDLTKAKEYLSKKTSGLTSAEAPF